MKKTLKKILETNLIKAPIAKKKYYIACHYLINSAKEKINLNNKLSKITLNNHSTIQAYYQKKKYLKYYPILYKKTYSSLYKNQTFLIYLPPETIQDTYSINLLLNLLKETKNIIPLTVCLENRYINFAQFAKLIKTNKLNITTIVSNITKHQRSLSENLLLQYLIKIKKFK